MRHNTKTKFYALVILACCTLLALPLVQASPRDCHDCHDCHESENIMCSCADGTYIDAVPISTDIAEMTADPWWLPYTAENFVTKDDTNNGGLRGNPIKLIVIVDAAAGAGQTLPAIKNAVNNLVESGDAPLVANYGIDFEVQLSYVSLWNPPTNMNYAQLLAEISKVKPQDVGCDVLMLLTGQSEISGNSITLGMANATSHRHFLMYANAASFPILCPLANLFQHEASHLFDCSDHGWDLTYCIMSYTYQKSYRGYCTGCNTQLNLNKNRFN